MYGLAWLLVPEPEVGTSALDQAIGQLRVRRVPPWLVLIGGAIVLWLGWFSWWSPGPTFPAIMLLAVLLLVLIHRLERAGRARPAGPVPAPVAGAWQAGAATGCARVDLRRAGTPAGPDAGVVTAAARHLGRRPATADRAAERHPAIDAGLAGRSRRGPPRAGPPPASDQGRGGGVPGDRLDRGGAADGFSRVPFPAYLWVGLAVLGTGLLVSLVTRRLTLSLLVPIAVLTLLAFALGGTRDQPRPTVRASRAGSRSPPISWSTTASSPARPPLISPP